MRNNPRYNWFFKYRLYHIPFWFAYHYLWWVITVGNPVAVVSSIFFSPYAIKYVFYVIFQALGVYFNLYFLIPKFLEKGRYVSYISLVLLTIIICAALIVPGYYLSASLTGKDFSTLYRVDPRNYLYFFQINTLPSTVASSTLAMSVKLTKNWIKSKRREQMFEKEKLETELKFLKSQINPHFLFNTINSIFVLIHKNPSMASESLAKFSDLLRYQLYECNDHQIPVHKELAFLDNFIELEKLRQDRHIDLRLNIEQPHGSMTIAPFILMPFIENAFKHVSKGKDRLNWINMHLEFKGNLLEFSIANSVSAYQYSSGDAIPSGGIGLKNIQRRLDLVYPERYTLSIHHKNDEFRVKLQISLNQSKVAEPAVYS